MAAASTHLSEKASALSGLIRSVERAPEQSTMAVSFPGLSSTGQGRRWFSLKGWPW